MSHIKKKITLGLAALGFVVLAGNRFAEAAPNANIAVTVTVDFISITVASNTWAIGQIAPNTSNISGAIDVTNSGNQQEDYQLSLAHSGDWSIGTSTTPTTDTFVLLGLFSSAASPSDSDFGVTNGTDDVITTIPQTATSDLFAVTEDAANTKGYDVGAGTSRTLRLNFRAPTVNTITDEQTITVTVTAIAG